MRQTLKPRMKDRDMALPVVAIVYFIFAVCCSTAQQECSETHTITGLMVFRVPPGTVCFQCNFGGGVATDSVFQLNNLNVGGEVGSVESGVLAIFAAEDVFQPTNPTSLSCTSGSNRISVIVFLKSLEPPQVPSAVSVTEGETLSLLCDVTNSNPPPSVSWITAEGEEVGGSTVVINDIQRNQAGNYICVATAEDGSSRSSTTVVTVTFAPEITADAGGLVKIPLNSTLELSCSFQAVPTPHSTTWTHNGTQLPSTLVTPTASSTTLTQTNLQANGGGAYVCRASNEIGSDTATMFVRVQLPPDSPSDLKVKQRATDSLTLAWNNPEFTGFAELTLFRINIARGETKRSETFDISGTPTQEHTVQSLSPLTFYTISLSLLNDARLESLPVTVQESTLSLRLSAAEEPVISVINSTAICLQWQPPSYDPDTTYPVTSYQLTYMKPDGTVTSRSLPPQPTSATVGNLDRGTVYVFTLTPYNTAGPGETHTYEATETLIDPPTPPREFTVSSPYPFTIQLSWFPPSSDGGRPIREYHIQLFISGEYSTTYNLLGSVRAYTIGRLSQNTSYEIRITAVNTDSQESQTVAVLNTTPPVGDPQPPALDTFSAAKVGNTRAEIAWETPGGYPHQYIIQIRQSSQRNWGISEILTIDVQLPPSRQTFLFQDLEPLTEYSVRVASENINALSEFTEIFSFKTYGDVEISGDGRVSVGSTLTLKCGLEGASDLERNINYTWSWSNGPLPTRASVGQDGVLVVVDVREEDSGVYTCTANGVTGNVSVEVSQGSNWSIVPIVAGSGGASVLVAFIIFTLVCIVWCYRKSVSSTNKVAVDDIDSPPVMDRLSHVYESLPFRVYNNPTTFIPSNDHKDPANLTPNKAYGVGLGKNPKEIELGKSLEDQYVEVRAGVRRQPEMIYDLAVHNPLQMVAAEESEEEYDEAYDPESDEEEACTNM